MRDWPLSWNFFMIRLSFEQHEPLLSSLHIIYARVRVDITLLECKRNGIANNNAWIHLTANNWWTYMEKILSDIEISVLFVCTHFGFFFVIFCCRLYSFRLEVDFFLIFGDREKYCWLNWTPSKFIKRPFSNFIKWMNRRYRHLRKN